MINRLPESFATRGPARTGVRDRVLADWDGDFRQWYSKVEKLVADNPAMCLMGAFFVGASIAWWIKRR